MCYNVEHMFESINMEYSTDYIRVSTSTNYIMVFVLVEAVTGLPVGDAVGFAMVLLLRDCVQGSSSAL